MLSAWFAEPALAADDARGLAREHYARGVAFANAGEYEQALGAFRRAYEASPHFAVLYNIAQAERLLGQRERALEAFERYLREGGDALASERRSEVQTEIDALKAELAREKESHPAPPEPVAPSPAITPPHPTASTASTASSDRSNPNASMALATTAPQSPAVASTSSGQRSVGYALGLLGLGLGGAAVVHWRWNDGRYDDWKSAYDDYREAPAASERARLNEQARSVDRASNVTVGLSIGAALSFGTGVVLLLTSGGSSDTRSGRAAPCWVSGLGLCSRW